MGNHRHPTRRPNPAHGFGQIDPRMGHIARLALHQIFAKHRRNIFNLTAFNQKSPKVRAADLVGVGTKRHRPFKRIGNAHFRQSGSHLVRPPHPPIADALQPSHQGGMVNIHIQTDNVQGAVFPCHRNLYPANQANARCGRSGTCLGDTGGAIVVGQREELAAPCHGACHDFGRR